MSPITRKALAPYLGRTYEELMQHAGYIEEVVPYEGYTEKLYKDNEGELDLHV